MKLTDKMDKIYITGEIISPGTKGMESCFNQVSHFYSFHPRIQADASSGELGQVMINWVKNLTVVSLSHSCQT